MHNITKSSLRCACRPHRLRGELQPAIMYVVIYNYIMHLVIYNYL